MDSPESPATSGSLPRVLLVACDYDADTSPQGMRWVNLSREMAALGWKVDVLTWRRSHDSPPPARVHVYRAYPGIYQGSVECIKSIRRRFKPVRDSAGASHSAAAQRPAGGTVNSPRLNWKGRLERNLFRLASGLMYPDLRREGMPFLKSAARRLLARNRYALVILSHEPPFALELLDMVSARGIAVVADLGDPVCAAYTPPRWRRRASRLEAHVCSAADAVVVTSDSTLHLLEDRHGRLPEGSMVVTQGFQPLRTLYSPTGRGSNDVRLIYTGRFYRFRDPTAVIEAVAATEGVFLELAVPELPEWLSLPTSNVLIHQRLSYEQARALQRTADVLLVIGNDDPTQTPGKLFEYFGVPAPILYVARHPDDPAARLLESLRRGRVVAADRDEVAAALGEFRELHRQGRLAEVFDLSGTAVAPYAWPELARRYADLMARLISTRVKSAGCAGLPAVRHPDTKEKQ
jgi:hypothetical protein